MQTRLLYNYKNGDMELASQISALQLKLNLGENENLENKIASAVSNALAKAVQKTDNNKDDPGQKDQDKESSSSTEKPEDKTDGEEQSSTEKAPEGTTQADNPEGNTGEEGGPDYGYQLSQHIRLLQ